ncbi:archaellin/type IV pilin N-terminal domain-containing protein [Nanoarchaeota archaeon]
MLHSKKGLSPLIAAVLLIVVVVSVGAIVTGLVRGLVTENQQTIASKSGEMECSRDVMVKIVEVNDELQVCKGSDYVYAIVENQGAAEIDDFQMVIMATTGFFSNDSVSPSMAFSPGAVTDLNVSFTGVSADDILQVKMVPKLKKGGTSKYFFCSDAAVKTESLLTC